jgi:predicted protein tyrosine phosphatase
LRNLRSTGIFGAELSKAVDQSAAGGARLVTSATSPEATPFSSSRLARLAEALERIAGARPSRRKAIRDVSTPGPAFEAEWPEVSERLRSLLDAGENILVHCRGGLGRAGMIAARLLVETGVDPDVAMERVRAVRPGAIETGAQEQWVQTGPRLS